MTEKDHLERRGRRWQNTIKIDIHEAEWRVGGLVELNWLRMAKSFRLLRMRLWAFGFH